jgi:hypothetical protein
MPASKVGLGAALTGKHGLFAVAVQPRRFHFRFT